MEGVSCLTHQPFMLDTMLTLFCRVLNVIRNDIIKRSMDSFGGSTQTPLGVHRVP